MSAGGYAVRPYESGDEEGILRLFNEVFGEGDENFQPRSLGQWQWLFQDNPCGNQIMVAARDDGRIIAHYACLPVAVNVQGQREIAGQGVDSMVHADYRRGLKREGPFLAVARAYFDTWGNARHCCFGFGYPNRRAFRVGVRVLRYGPVHQPITTLYRNFFAAPDDDEVGRGLEKSAEVEEVASFSPDVDELWRRLAPQFPFAIIRDRAYLSWRYTASPELTYRCFEIRRDGQLCAWFVTRAGWQGVPILALADFLADPRDENAVGLTLRHAVRAGREAEQARVEAWLPPRSPFFSAARRHGFESEPSQYVLCAMLYRDQPELDWVRDHWYFTIGDSDVF